MIAVVLHCVRVRGHGQEEVGWGEMEWEIERWWLDWRGRLGAIPVVQSAHIHSLGIVLRLDSQPLRGRLYCVKWSVLPSPPGYTCIYVHVLECCIIIYTCICRYYSVCVCVCVAYCLHKLQNAEHSTAHVSMLSLCVGASMHALLLSVCVRVCVLWLQCADQC